MLNNLIRSVRRLPAMPAAAQRQDAADHEHWRAERTYWREQLRGWMYERYGLALDPLQDDDATAPGGELVARIQATYKSRPDAYFATGCRTALEMLRELDAHGFAANRFEQVLEFGVGTGRLLRHFLPFRCERIGCDVTPEVAEFSRRIFGSLAKIDITRLAPPLPYAEGAFDFVYANSVFTHIQKAETPAWIEELARVLRPGGALIATVFDPNHYLRHLSPREFDQMASGPGYHQWGTSDVMERFMYMTPQTLFAAWSERFDILELRQHFRDQSHLVLSRR